MIHLNRNLSMTNHAGYLELIVGPMYSGKTSYLVDVYKKCKFCNIPVVAINHSIDNRYDENVFEHSLYTHDKINVPCVKTDNLAQIWQSDEFKQYNVILINEGQFFGDLYEVVCDMVKSGKKVYVSGLDGDFERNKFGQILDLIPQCDSVTKLTSLCSICSNGTKAIFSLRITDHKAQTLVGSDIYKPVCRKCYETSFSK
jgi:thymidine kinase